MKNNRLVRVNDEILREVSNIIRQELKDPRVGVLTSVTRVDTSNDLKFCKVYVSVLGNAEEQSAVMAGLSSASGFIRSQIASRINLRSTPQLSFVLDDSLAHSMRINALIKEVNSPKTQNKEAEEENENA